MAGEEELDVLECGVARGCEGPMRGDAKASEGDQGKKEVKRDTGLSWPFKMETHVRPCSRLSCVSHVGHNSRFPQAARRVP